MKKTLITLLVLSAFVSTQTVFAAKTKSTVKTTSDSTVTTVRKTNNNCEPPQWNFDGNSSSERPQPPEFSGDGSNRPQPPEFGSNDSQKSDFGRGNMGNCPPPKMGSDDTSESTDSHTNCKPPRKPRNMSTTNSDFNSDTTKSNRPQFQGKMMPMGKQFRNSGSNDSCKPPMMKFEHMNKETTETETTAE